MKRKVIQLAGKTSVISLPHSWVKKFNIKKGDEIDLTEEENKIIIETTRQIKTKDVILDISEMNASTAWYNIISSYRSGAEQITIYHNDYIMDIKTNNKIKSSELLRDAVNKLMGMEIIGNEKNHVVIREVTTPKQEELDNVVKRIYFTLLNMSSEIIASAKNNDRENLERIGTSSEDNVNKLSNFSLRLISKNTKKQLESNVLYSIIIKLEEIGDYYSVIAKTIAKQPNIKKEITVILSDTDNMLKKFYDISFKHDQEKHNEMAVLKSKIKKQLYVYQTKNEEETKMLQAISNIPNILMEASCIKLTNMF